MAGVVNNDFIEVMTKRNARKVMDPNLVIPREEILEMVKLATTAPSAVNSQPWRFLVVDTDEGKQKLERVMHPPMDTGRVTASSFSVVVFADRNWLEGYDEIMEKNIESAPASFPPEMRGMFTDRILRWMDELTEAGELDSSISFQAGLVTMQLMLTARAFGYDTAVMDDWSKWELDQHFDLDLKRFVPMVVIQFGKATTPAAPVPRRDPEDTVWFAEPLD